MLALGVSDAQAQRAYRDGISGGGYCPTGTCSKGGGPRANDLKNCRKKTVAACSSGTERVTSYPTSPAIGFTSSLPGNTLPPSA